MEIGVLRCCVIWRCIGGGSLGEGFEILECCDPVS